MFARMRDGSLYFYEDEGERNALFVVRLGKNFSVSTISGSAPREHQFEIKDNGFEGIRKNVDEIDADDGFGHFVPCVWVSGMRHVALEPWRSHASLGP